MHHYGREIIPARGMGREQRSGGDWTAGVGADQPRINASHRREVRAEEVLYFIFFWGAVLCARGVGRHVQLEREGEASGKFMGRASMASVFVALDMDA